MMKYRPQYVPELLGALLLSGVVATSLSGSDENGVLGPVDSILLAGSDGDLTIRNVGDRISWSKEKTSTVWSIGFMEVGKALSALLRADHFIEARDDLNEELNAQLESVREILDALIEEGKALEQDDPKAAVLRQKAEQIYSEFQQMQQLAAEARAMLVSGQMEMSYNEIVEAVNVVAERMNIDLVLRFIPPDGEFEKGPPDSMIMQIRLRTALRHPDGINITDEVLSELGLDVQ